MDTQSTVRTFKIAVVGDYVHTTAFISRCYDNLNATTVTNKVVTDRQGSQINLSMYNMDPMMDILEKDKTLKMVDGLL